MKPRYWRLMLGITLITLSLLFYILHYAIFRDTHHIFIYLIGDVAFLFTDVLLVTLIIDEAMSIRAKRALMEKLNMVIGSFYSEVGVRLLGTLAACDSCVEKIRRDLIVTARWTDSDFRNVKRSIGEYGYEIDIRQYDLAALKKTLLDQREFMLRLLENQNLLEHDAFTNLLMAVFHLTEELAARSSIDALSEPDIRHLALDIKRVYSLLTMEWLDYMKHLKINYPYLFSFAMRTNPFDPEAKPEIVEIPKT